MTITIWHNPRCSKSRQTLELLRKRGIDPTIREYLKEPPSKAEIEKLIDLVGGDPAELIRDGEQEFKTLRKKKSELGKVAIAAAIAAHPTCRGRGQARGDRPAARGCAAIAELAQ